MKHISLLVLVALSSSLRIDASWVGSSCESVTKEKQLNPDPVFEKIPAGNLFGKLCTEKPQNFGCSQLAMGLACILTDGNKDFCNSYCHGDVLSFINGELGFMAYYLPGTADEKLKAAAEIRLVVDEAKAKREKQKTEQALQKIGESAEEQNKEEPDYNNENRCQ